MAPEWTQPQTEMITRRTAWGVRRADNLTTFMSRSPRSLEVPQYWNSQGLSRAFTCNYHWVLNRNLEGGGENRDDLIRLFFLLKCWVTDGGDGSDDDSGGAMHEVLGSDYDLCVCL